MDLVIGIVLLASFFGILIYSLITGDITQTKILVQLLISGFGSILVLSPVVIRYVKGLIKREDSPKPDKEKEREMDNNEDLFNCDSKTMRDFKALHYLKERAFELDSKEALDLVVQLNTILFSTECKDTEKEKQDEDKI